jgi:hypothetical protein
MQKSKVIIIIIIKGVVCMVRVSSTPIADLLRHRKIATVGILAMN